MSEGDNGPRIPINGAAGAAIYAALLRISMYCGDATVTVRKERLPGGGYSYQLAYNYDEVKQRS